MRARANFLQADFFIAGALRRCPEETHEWTESLSKDRPIVVYCVKGGDVGESAARRHADDGRAARFLAGGVRGWAEHGGMTLPKPVGGSTLWVTWEPRKIDRIACPWLITRFIDREAQFRYLKAGDVVEIARKERGIPSISPTDGQDLDYLPDFSPRGDSVVFQSRKERAGIAHDLYRIGVDGRTRTRLTDEKNGYTSPKWSPDGKKILFERAIVTKKFYRDLSREEMGQMKSSTEICVMNSDGTNQKNLTNNEVEDSTPQWSRNGKTIYFMSRRDGSLNVYAMNADGANPRKIADGASVTNPFVSPDEKYVAYTKEVDGKWGLYVHEIGTGKARLLLGG